MNRKPDAGSDAVLILSLTAVVLMIQASIKRDQKLAWIISALGFLCTLWATGYAREFAQPVTILLQVDSWSLFFSALVVFAALVTLVLSRRVFHRKGSVKKSITYCWCCRSSVPWC